MTIKTERQAPLRADLPFSLFVNGRFFKAYATRRAAQKAGEWLVTTGGGLASYEIEDEREQAAEASPEHLDRHVAGDR